MLLHQGVGSTSFIKVSGHTHSEESKKASFTVRTSTLYYY